MFKEMKPQNKTQFLGLAVVVVLSVVIGKYVFQPMPSTTASQCYNTTGCICGCVETGRCDCKNCNEPKLK